MVTLGETVITLLAAVERAVKQSFNFPLIFHLGTPHSLLHIWYLLCAEAKEGFTGKAANYEITNALRGEGEPRGCRLKKSYDSLFFF